MIPNRYNGKLFAFEGMDGNGKTMQLAMVYRWLGTMEHVLHNGFAIKKEKEPGKDRPWGAAIYKELVKPNGLHTTDLVGFQRWYACDSKDHMPETIRSLNAGCVVLMDRYRHSMVFGVPKRDSPEARQAEIEKLMTINCSIVGEHFIWPDATFIFDVSVETAIARLKKKFAETGKGTFDEHEKEEKLVLVRSNYQLFARMYPNCHLIDAEGSPEEVFEKVKPIVEPIVSQIRSIF